MKQKPNSRRKRTTTKSVLHLPDLEHAKAAVLNSLTCRGEDAVATAAVRKTAGALPYFDSVTTIFVTTDGIFDWMEQ